MGINSDGEKKSDDAQGKLPSLLKKRSNSIGSTINLSQAEINRVIGIDNGNNSKQINTHFFTTERKNDSKQTNTVENGQQNKQDKGSFGTSDINLSEDFLFQPRNSVTRTPPNVTLSEDNSNEESIYYQNMNSQKRPRSESSPTFSDKSKVKKNNQQYDVPTETESHCQTHNTHDYTVQSTEEILNELLESLQIIHTHYEIDNQNDTRHILSALFTVHRHVTTFAFRIGQTEKANLQLKNEIKDITTNKRAETLTQNSQLDIPGTSKLPINGKSSFSEIVKSVAASNDPGNISGASTWKTPPTRKPKHETVIKIKGQTDSRAVIQEIKSNFKINNAGENFKSVKQTQSGSVIIECRDASQQQKLNENLAKSIKNVEMKNITSTDPMVMITGILKGFTPQDFIKEFIYENPSIIETFGDDVEDCFKFITKRDCRNNTKENWIYQTPPEIFKWLIRNNFLTLDMCPVYVKEYTNVALCFKCCLFGHVAKHCTTSECCHKCGGAHNPTRCTTTIYDCPNCKRSNLTPRNHTARDPTCPVYIQRIHRLKQSTNYANSETFLPVT